MSAYSFTSISATLQGPGGSIPVGSGAGSAEEGISVSMNDDKGSMMIGADGSVMHSLHAGKSGSISIRLLKTSPINARLSQMYNLQTANGSAALYGVNTLVVSDINRGDVISAKQVGFKKLPDNAFQKDGNVMEWVFNCGVIDELLGSGSPVA